MPEFTEVADGLTMPLADAMRTQRAVRRLRTDPVDDATLLAVLELAVRAPTGSNQQGWEFIALIAPVAMMSLALWRRPGLFSWPRSLGFERYRMGWFGLALPILAYAFVVGLFLEGSATPLAYLPLLNPLELALVAVGFLGYGLVGEVHALASSRRIWPLLAFAFVIIVGFYQLLVGESAGEGDEQGGHHEVEKQDPRIVALVGLDEVAGTVCQVFRHDGLAQSQSALFAAE